jgi:hypothetical protein
LKATNPDLYNIIDSGIQAAGSARGAVIDSLSTSRTRVGFAIQSASETGEVRTPPSATAAEIRAVHQGVAMNVKSAVEIINKSPDAVGSDPTITSNMVRNVEALFKGITPQGGAVTVAKDVDTINRAFKKLAPEDFSAVKAAASQGSITTVNNIKAVMLDIEREFGVMPQLGVNDAGEIKVLLSSGTEVPPTPAPTEPRSALSINPAILRRQEEDERRRQERRELGPAAVEANKRLGPMLQNLVNTRLIVEDKPDATTRKAISTEMATIINSGQPYRGFFTLEAKPVEAAPTQGQPSGETPTGGGNATDILNSFKQLGY